MQAHHTTRGWLSVEWHLGGWWLIVAKLFRAVLFCNAYSSLPGNHYCPLPGGVCGSLPGNICQCPAWARLRSLHGTLASFLPGNTWQCPPWERLPVPCLGCLPVPCLGTLASPLPGNACQCACFPWPGRQSLPGTLASSLPGNACQFLAWERLPVPCLGTFCSPCLGRFASSLPGSACQCPAWALANVRQSLFASHLFASPCLGRLPVPCLGTPFALTPSLAEPFSYAYRTSMRRELLRLFKPSMPLTRVPCYYIIFVSAMNVK